jgi:hypothetical protein
MSTAVANVTGNHFNEGTGSGNAETGSFASATGTRTVSVQSFAGALSGRTVTLRRNQWPHSATIDPTQAWFWTPEWQEGEAEVLAEYEASLSEFFSDEDEFLADLDQ